MRQAYLYCMFASDDTRLLFTGLAAVTLISCKDTAAQMGGCDRLVCMSRVKSRKEENKDKKERKGMEE